MPSALFNGSIQPILNTVHIMGTISTSGVYVFKVDAGQMINGDEIELRMADIVGAGTVSCIYLASYSHKQASQIKASPPLPVEVGGGHVSIVKRAGASPWFYFSVLNI